MQFSIMSRPYGERIGPSCRLTQEQSKPGAEHQYVTQVTISAYKANFLDCSLKCTSALPGDALYLRGTSELRQLTSYEGDASVSLYCGYATTMR